MNTFKNFLLNEDKNRLQLKIDVLCGKKEGKLLLKDVYEIIDQYFPNLELSKRQIEKMIKKAKDSYGY